MIRVPVDAAWVRRIAGLADGPWTEEAVTEAFARYGWTWPAEGSENPPALPWRDLGDLVPADGEGGDSGWTMYFYEAPPSGEDPGAVADPDSGMALFCAGFWPPDGAEDTGESDGPGGDRDEMLRIADRWAACVAEPDARRAAFLAEYDRIHALVRDVFGEPTRTVRGVGGAVHTIWDRGVTALILIMEPCAMNHDATDWIALRLAPGMGAAVRARVLGRMRLSDPIPSQS